MQPANNLNPGSSGAPRNAGNPRRAKAITKAIFILLWLLGTGCVHYRTPSEREASFSPYKEATVGPDSLRKHMITRSAVLLKADRLVATESATHSLRIGNTNAWHGTASAIDTRGYFLTAAHCVENGQFWLAFPRDGTLQVERARIVWRGEAHNGGPDLAILSVSHPIDAAFEWAGEVTNGSPVMDVGLSLDDKSHILKSQCMAGTILKVSNGLSAAPAGYTVVAHSSPLHHGDSGGPLVLSDGRLVGINVSETLDFHWSQLAFEPEHSEAQRPNLEWLRQIIEADFRLNR